MYLVYLLRRYKFSLTLKLYTSFYMIEVNEYELKQYYEVIL